VLLAVTILLEIGLRFFLREDAGQDALFGMKLLPFPTLSPAHDVILRSEPSDWTYYQPDAATGWAIKPNGKSRDGLFVANSLGLRDAEVGEPTRLGSAKHRILLLGDSFTHGDEVPYEATWGHQLEGLLGQEYAVLNGGVGGYGTDQALLRWRGLHPSLQPQTVILGIFPEDLWRNLTFFRVLKHHWSSFPFSKPRFVRTTSGLLLLNQPVLPPEAVADALARYESHALSRDDLLYFHEFHEDRFLDGSLLLRWMRSKSFYSRRHNSLEAMIAPGGAGTILMADLVNLFQTEAAQRNCRSLVILIPGASDLPSYADLAPSASGGRLKALAEELRARKLDFVDVGHDLRKNWYAKDTDRSLRRLYTNGTGHPTQEGNAVIANTLKGILLP
jgi:hypothetical protein